MKSGLQMWGEILFTYLRILQKYSKTSNLRKGKRSHFKKVHLFIDRGKPCKREYQRVFSNFIILTGEDKFRQSLMKKGGGKSVRELIREHGWIELGTGLERTRNRAWIIPRIWLESTGELIRVQGWKELETGN